MTFTKQILNYLKNAVKWPINKLSFVITRRWEELTRETQEISIKKEITKINMEEEKEVSETKTNETKTDDTLKLLQEEIQVLRKYKEDNERLIRRKEMFTNINDDKLVKYLNLMIDAMEGDDDKEKYKQLQTDLPQLFKKQDEKETEKQFEVDVKPFKKNSDEPTKLQKELAQQGVFK